MDSKGNFYPENTLYLLTGEQLNVAIWAMSLLIDDFPPGSDGRRALEKVITALRRKESYEKLLDRMGLPQAPDENEIQGFDEWLSQFGLKPPEDSERN